MRTLLALALFFGIASTVQASPVEEAKKALYMWSPKEINRQKNTLVVVLDERKITQKIYTAAMQSGICAFAGTGRIELKGIKSVAIINRYAAQGYLFEGGKSDCKDIANMPLDKAKISLLGKTRAIACTGGEWHFNEDAIKSGQICKN